MSTVPVNLTWTTDRPTEEVRAWVRNSVADTLHRSGYRTRSDTAAELVMEHAAPASWPLALFSVVAYLLSRHHGYQVVFKFLSDPDGRTQMIVIGELPTKVAAILEDLPQSG